MHKMTGYIQLAPYNLPTSHYIKVHNNASQMLEVVLTFLFPTAS
jgi:hypothetical protein